MSYDVDVLNENFNYTYNLGKFFTQFEVNPNMHMNGRSTGKVAKKIELALAAIADCDQAALAEKYDPPNGWGGVEGAVDWLTRIREACLRHPGVIVETW